VLIDAETEKIPGAGVLVLLGKQALLGIQYPLAIRCPLAILDQGKVHGTLCRCDTVSKEVGTGTGALEASQTVLDR